MNHKALLQLGSELLHHFRHAEGPADTAFAEYTRNRKFLGSTDKRFIADIYYYTLRHLRRIDEAILSAFDGTIASETRYSSGFPVTSQMGGRAWERRVPGDREAEQPRWRPFDRMVDTLRMGLAAVEMGLDTSQTVAEELERTWPKLEGKNQPQLETLERLVGRASEVMDLYARSNKPVDQERRYSFPSWLWGMIADGRAIEELAALGEALNKPGEGCLRVNTLRATPEEGDSALAAAQISFRTSNLVDTALILQKRVPPRVIPHFDDGWFEFQDEGSQLVTVYASPSPETTVVDACAGGGGKTLHLAAMMQNTGKIYAFDSSEERLEQLFRRLHRAGAHNIDMSLKLTPEGEPPDTADLPLADLVLIDAPCTGTGTMRRSPEIRWRLSSGYVEMLRDTQKALLDRWAPRVRVGGHLVYATCSILTAENELQIDRFLDEHKEFRLAPPASFPVPLTWRGELRLAPHKNGCDGFYAARLQRHS